MTTPPSATQQDAWSQAGRAIVHAERCLNLLLEMNRISPDDELKLRNCIKILEGFNGHETRKSGRE